MLRFISNVNNSVISLGNQMDSGMTVRIFGL